MLRKLIHSPFVMVALAVIAVLVVCVGFPITVAVTGAHFEAKAFNNVTGAQITTRQAFFLDLRVVSTPLEYAKPE